MTADLKIIQGDCLEKLREIPDSSIHCCVTSPPYWGLRDYGVAGQIGLEKTLEEYVAKIVAVFREVWRVLRGDGTLWLNLGDSYASNWACKRRNIIGEGSPDETCERGRMAEGLKEKDLCGIPWRVAFALQQDGWYLRSDIIWHKPNPMPESVTDRPTKSHEYLFLLSKSQSYFYDAEAIKEAVTGGAHPRANGEHSRMVMERAAGREHSKPNPPRSHIPGVTPKSALEGSGIKANESFHAATTELVLSRNKRTVWTIPTAPYKGAHFATFPPNLVRPCILAGTSQKGCCPKCGGPWERVIERSPMEINRSDRGDKIFRGNHSTTASGTMVKPSEVNTIGWAPACECGLPDTIPCTVLDPFFGSGTTGMVALQENRSVVGVELSFEYIFLAYERCSINRELAL